MNNFNIGKKIIIVGGGFGGIRAALDLEKQKIPETRIILISDKPHFEYTPTLYQVVTGYSPLEVCVPLREIFNGKSVELIEDSIIEFNLPEKILKGTSGSHYSFDFLVLALGSETAYFNIPGMRELSFGFKSITEALRLKRHLHDLFSAAKDVASEEKVSACHVVIVGGGATGTELAGELAIYTRELAEKHGLDASFVTVDLIEAAPRLLSALPEDVSKKVYNRLHRLGVNIFLQRIVVREEVEEIYMKDIEMKTKTVIWTAGVKPNHLYSQIQGLQFDKKGRVLVDEFLRSKEFPNVFILGDAAATVYSGMAQTAINDGKYVASAIARNICLGKSPLPYKPQNPAYAIPIGPRWAAVSLNSLKFYGRIGWWLRRLADLRFFLSILPFRKAVTAFRSGKTLCESCNICSADNNHEGAV